MRTRIASVSAGLLVLTATGACAEGAGTERMLVRADEQRLRIVTTVSPLTSIVSAVAGEHAAVAGIVPEGANSHEFEPAPSVATTLAGADIVFANGLHLEEPALALAETNLADGAEIVELGTAISEDEWIFDFSFPREGGDPNPHLWTNPPYVSLYAEGVAATLARRDPANADAYRDNAAKLQGEVAAFDAALRQASDTVPPEKRRLLTYHDSFAYFARDYGWQVVGAIQPSDFSEPSAQDVAGLIDQIRAESVPAVFGSEVFPSSVLEQIAAESGARYVDDLRDDDLPGEPGESGHTLLELLRFDYTTIIAALSGDPAALVALDSSDGTRDQAEYAQ